MLNIDVHNCEFFQPLLKSLERALCAELLTTPFKKAHATIFKCDKVEACRGYFRLGSLRSRLISQAFGSK